jgi:hypothetical protein
MFVHTSFNASLSVCSLYAAAVALTVASSLPGGARLTVIEASLPTAADIDRLLTNTLITVY